MRAVIAVRFTETEKATAVFTAQSGKQFIKTNLNEAWSPDHVDDRANALADGGVGHRKSLVNPGFRQHHVPETIVLEANDRIRDPLQLLQGLGGLGAATFAFKGEGQSGKSQNERPALARHLR